MEPLPEPPDLTLVLPRDTYHHLIHTLRAALPPPPIGDSPEAPGSSPVQALVRRDNAAMAQVAALLPATADEASLAATYVAANAQAMECLRLARQDHADPNFVRKFTTLAAGMLREARATRSLLLRVQAERRRREADNAATDRAAWTEHCAITLMAEALDRPHPEAMAEPPPPSVPVAAEQAPPQADPITEAEHYAVTYPRRAALIRRLGRVPDNVTFGPPEDYLVRALVTGRTPALLALDREAAEACAV
jgi:hypothetical protein